MQQVEVTILKVFKQAKSKYHKSYGFGSKWTEK